MSQPTRIGEMIDRDLDGAARRRCQAKNRYPTEAAAEAARGHREPRAEVPLRVYACPLCQGFHLTKVQQTPIVAKADRVWRGSLYVLGRRLREEAKANPGEWAWRQLPRGALVAFMLSDEGGETLRIARQSVPETSKARAGWDREVAVFLRQLQAEGWETTTDIGAGTISCYAWPKPKGAR